MEYIKKTIKILGIMYAIIILSIFLITIFNYFNIISGIVLKVFLAIIPIISTFIGGILIGKKATQKGWLEGLKLALIFLVILVIFNYLALSHWINLKNLIYYLIIIFSTIFGSMIGINKKEKDV